MTKSAPFRLNVTSGHSAAAVHPIAAEVAYEIGDT